LKKTDDLILLIDLIKIKTMVVEPLQVNWFKEHLNEFSSWGENQGDFQNLHGLGI
jgi:hypothetical protein